jgi:predicted MPP superfamily phosphohydrolase
MRSVRILHIGDLHLTKKRHFDQSIILSAFLSDLTTLRNRGMKPDLILFSGDLANDPDEAEIYDHALEAFFLPTFEATGLTDDELVLTPGNHDVSRSAVREQEYLQSGLLGKLIDRTSINDFYNRDPNSSFITSKHKSFFDMKRHLSAKYCVAENAFWQAFYFPRIHASVVSINTAWMSSAGLLGSDQNILMVPEAALHAAFSSVPKQAPVLLLGHHPVDWLAESCRSDFTYLLQKRSVIYFHGHLHEARPSTITTTEGQVLRSQVGALYQGRERYNGYTLITLDLDTMHAEYQLRSFFDRRREFDKAIDVAPEGTFYSSVEAKEFWSRVTRPVDPENFTKWLRNEVYPALATSLNEGLSDVPVSQLFVHPSLSQRSGFNASEEEENGNAGRIEFADLVKCGDNFLVVARPEYGKTTLLRQIGYECLRQLVGTIQQRVPILMDFRDIRVGGGRFQRAVLGAMPAVARYGFEAEDVIRAGLALIMIDDFDPNDDRRREELFGFISAFPDNRYIISMNRLPVQEFVAVMNVAAPIPFDTLYINPFSRQLMRRLIEKWPLQQSVDRDTILDRLVSTIAYINVPLTAVNGTILLQIFEEEADFNPINNAVLIERYVELRLDKARAANAKRSSFDYRNKIHLLSHIAREMTYQNTYRIPYERAIETVRSYMILYGLPGDPLIHINNFIDSRVIALRDGLMYFRYRAFLEFFIAQQMIEEESFREYIISEERYLSFVNEIEYYAGLKRNDLGLVKTIAERFDKLDQRFNELVQVVPDFARLDDLQPTTASRPGDTYDELQRQLAAPKLTQEERDQLLEVDLPENVEEKQDVYRPLYEHDGQKWIASLVLYSGIVRNLELIEDGHKRDHLRNVLEGWARFLYHSLYVVPILAKQRKVTINGVVYELRSSEKLSDDELTYRLFLAFPRSASNLVKLYLGSEKLESQLRDVDLREAKEPRIVRFFRWCLYCDMRLPKWPEVLLDLEKYVSGSDYLLRAYLWKLRSMLHRVARTESEDEGIRKAIGSALSRLAPGSSAERKIYKSNEMQKIDKAKLLEQLRIRIRREQKE